MVDALTPFLQLVPQLDEESKNSLVSSFTEIFAKPPSQSKQKSLVRLLGSCFCRCTCQKSDDISDEVWTVISEIVQSSSIQEARSLFNQQRRLRIAQRPWSRKEDELLRKIIARSKDQDGELRWNQVARELADAMHKPLRLTRHVRDRWVNKLNPNLHKGPWDLREEQQLLMNVLTLGKDWKSISERMGKQRTESSLKNRFFQILRKMEKEPVEPLTREELEQQVVALTKMEASKDIVSELGHLELTSIIKYQEILQAKILQQDEEAKGLKRKFESEEHKESKVEQASQTLAKPKKDDQKRSKANQKDNKAHAKSIIHKILDQVPQESYVNFDKISNHYQEIIKQKGDTLALDEEPFSNSNDLEDIQFAVVGKDHTNLHVFPKEQLKAVMEMIKSKQLAVNPEAAVVSPLPKDTKQPTAQNRISNLPPPLPKTEVNTKPSKDVPISPVSHQQVNPQQPAAQTVNQPIYQIIYPPGFCQQSQSSQQNQIPLQPQAMIPMSPFSLPQPMLQMPQQQLPMIGIAQPQQLGQMAQLGQIAQMAPMGQVGQLPQMGQIGQMGQIQMAQLPQMGQMNQMGQMGQMGQMNQLPQMGQIGQMGQLGQMGQQMGQTMIPQMTPQSNQAQNQQTFPYVPLMYAPQPIFQAPQQPQQRQQGHQGGSPANQNQGQNASQQQPYQQGQQSQGLGPQQFIQYPIMAQPAYFDPYGQMYYQQGVYPQGLYAPQQYGGLPQMGQLGQQVAQQNPPKTSIQVKSEMEEAQKK